MQTFVRTFVHFQSYSPNCAYVWKCENCV